MWEIQAIFVAVVEVCPMRSASHVGLGVLTGVAILSPMGWSVGTMANRATMAWIARTEIPGFEDSVPVGKESVPKRAPRLVTTLVAATVVARGAALRWEVVPRVQRTVIATIKSPAVYKPARAVHRRAVSTMFMELLVCVSIVKTALVALWFAVPAMPYKLV